MRTVPDPTCHRDAHGHRASTCPPAPSARRLRTAAWSALAALALAGNVLATPVTITTPFMNLEHRNVNSLGFTPGEFVRFGANSVVPNGSQGTTGLATQLGTGTTRTVFFDPSPVVPNFFARYLTDAPGLRGDWMLSFRNGADVSSVQVGLAPDVQQAPFVQSITLSGTAANPTFGWAPPPGTVVNGYRVNIFDKNLAALGLGSNVVSRNLTPDTTSFTVTAADFTVPGYAFTQGTPYAIEISLIQTRDGSSSNLGNSNIQAIARSYADFTASTGNQPVVNLPVVLQNGAYQFNMAVVPGQTYFIDPDVAVGYDYQVGAGNPLFASVLLPTGFGDGLYDIFGVDPFGAATLLAAGWQGGQVFDFGPDGLAHFRVLGIETSAMLNPANTTAFVTGVQFVGAGLFTGTQTPITVFVSVPEPSALALLALALAGMWLGTKRAGSRARGPAGAAR